MGYMWRQVAMPGSTITKSKSKSFHKHGFELLRGQKSLKMTAPINIVSYDGLHKVDPQSEFKVE